PGLAEQAPRRIRHPNACKVRVGDQPPPFRQSWAGGKLRLTQTAEDSVAQHIVLRAVGIVDAGSEQRTDPDDIPGSAFELRGTLPQRLETLAQAHERLRIEARPDLAAIGKLAILPLAER